MNKPHWLWLFTCVGLALLAMVFIYSDGLPRLPFSYN